MADTPRIYSQILTPPGGTSFLKASEELELATRIAQAKHHSALKDNGDDYDQAVINDGDRACVELVSHYAPLVESLAAKSFKSCGGYGMDRDDYIQEAYYVAFQCAKTYDPTRSATMMRFSSYAARAIATALNNLSLRSHTPVSVPMTTMAEAKRWAQAYYDIESIGVEPMDALVSMVCGTTMTSAEARLISGLSMMAAVDEAAHIPANDMPYKDNEGKRDILTRAVKNAFGEDSRPLLAILGLNKRRKSLTSRASIDGVKGGGRFAHIADDYRAFVNHPSTLAAVKKELEKLQHDN